MVLLVSTIGAAKPLAALLLYAFWFVYLGGGGKTLLALLSVRSAIGRPYQYGAYSQHDNDLTPQLQVRKERVSGMNE